MTIQILTSIFRNKIFEINGKYYHFEYGGKLIITSNNSSTSDTYQIVSKNNEFYLQTNEPIIGDKKEAQISLLIGNCDNGIALTKWN